MTGAWGRILARYGQSVTLRRGRRNRTAGRFSSRCGSGGRTGTRSRPLRWGRRGGISGSIWGRRSFRWKRRTACAWSGTGLRFAVRAAQPVCVGEETLYWWALLAVEDGEAQTEQT
ncbi:MAG: hypothetical protein ACLRNQ_03920 [Flavonifractor plautii]